MMNLAIDTLPVFLQTLQSLPKLKQIVLIPGETPKYQDFIVEFVDDWVPP